jgi:hypothetical protein
VAKKEPALPRRGADVVRLQATPVGERLWRHRAVKLVFVIRRDQDLRDFSKR